MSTKPNARFWIHYNDDWAKITLKPGQTIKFYSGGPTDEGVSHASETYEYDDHEDVVIAQFTYWGRDCDGGYQWNSDYYARVSELKAVDEEPLYERTNFRGEEVNITLPRRPRWMQKHEWQRDQYAEQMGY